MRLNAWLAGETDFVRNSLTKKCFSKQLRIGEEDRSLVDMFYLLLPCFNCNPNIT